MYLVNYCLHFLKLLERFLGINLLYLVRGTSWLSFGTIVGTLGAFFLSMAYARYLSKDVYGNYRFILTIISMAGIFSLPGLGFAITRSVAQGFEGSYLKNMRIIFFSSFGITAVAIITSLVFYSQGNETLFLGFLFASMLIPFVEGLGNWRGYLDGKKEFKKKTFYNSVIHMLYTVSMLGTVYIIYRFRLSQSASILFLTTTYMMTHAIPNIILFFKIKKNILPQAPIDPTSISLGIHISVSSIPATLATYFDGLLLFSFLGPQALATYSFAIAIPEQIKKVTSNANIVALPKLVTYLDKQKISQLRKTLPKKAIIASSFTTLGVLFYILIAPFVFNVFFPRYTDAIPYSQVFALSLAFMPFTIFNTALDVEGNTRKIYAQKIITPFIQILLLLILIPLFGLWGAIIGRLIGRYLNNICSYFLFIYSCESQI